MALLYPQYTQHVPQLLRYVMSNSPSVTSTFLPKCSTFLAIFIASAAINCSAVKGDVHYTLAASPLVKIHTVIGGENSQ